MDRIDVLQLGPGLEVRGGVSSVERLIVERLARGAESSVSIRHVATMEDGSAWHKLGVFLRALYVVRAALQARRCGAQHGSQIVHIHFSKRGSTLRKTLLAWMVLRAGRPLVLHAHSGSFDQFFSRLPRLARRLLKRIFGRADCVIVLSRHWRDFYARQVGLDLRRIVVLHNPVALPRSVPARAGRQSVQLVYLGRIAEHKGAFDLLRAYGALPASLRLHTRIVFAGDGKVEQLREQAREWGDAIEIHTWIDSHARDILLAQSDVFVLPSYYEGVPMAMLEAMAYGLPVVTTRVGGIPDIVQDQREGLLIAPGEPEQLQDALRQVIEDEGWRLALGRQARLCAQRFDADRYARDLLHIYRQVLAQHGQAHARFFEEAA